MNIHKNARTNAVQSTADGSSRWCRCESGQCRGRFLRQRANRKQMGAALAGWRRDRAAGPQLKAGADARHASGAHHRHRTAAAATDELAGDRAAARHAQLAIFITRVRL